MLRKRRSRYYDLLEARFWIACLKFTAPSRMLRKAGRGGRSLLAGILRCPDVVA